MTKERADKILVSLGLAQTRSKASQMISRGEVSYHGSIINKSSLLVESEGITVNSKETYVGRGAYKLVGAIKNFSLKLKGKTIADIGASTGGFTQVCLLEGAKKVFAIDVGHDQLDPIIANDERVINLERTNIRECDTLGEFVDVVVVDLSFISLETVFLDIIKHLKSGGEGIFLIKPQFELNRKSLTKRGVVKDREMVVEVLEKMFDFILPQEVCESPLKGKEGNVEYLFYFIKDKTTTSYIKSNLRELVTSE